MIELKNINKSFGSHKILKNFSLLINDGEFIAITGESGRGKTTLLNIIGFLDKPDSGDIIIDNIHNPSEKKILMYQRYKFSYLFQNYALIENETVYKNMVLALKYRKDINKKQEIEGTLAQIGLNSFLNKKVYELSGGEQQKVALARAYIKDPQYIFADEPTGNLDIKNRDIVFDTLKKMNRQGKTIIFVTHDNELSELADRHIKI